MQEKVEYILTIKDLLTGALNKAEKQADTFEKKLGNLGKTAIAAFGAYEAYNFIKESVAAYDEAAQASAQLDATLKSTGNAANLSRKALDEQAQSLMNMSRFDDDAVTSAQALLGTFTNIGDKVFMDTIPAIADLAAKMGTDLESQTIRVGKALNDPIKGVSALTKVGVNFSDKQKKLIESLVKTGKTAEAQKIILAELNKEFGGSAKAAAEAGTGPLVVLAHQLGNVKETIGKVVIELVSFLKPAMIMIGEYAGKFASYLENNTDKIKSVAIGIGLAATAFAIYRGYLLASAAATQIMTLYQMGLNAAISANPVGAAVAAFIALSAVLAYAWHKSETFRQGVYTMYEFVKTYISQVIDYFKALGNIIIGAVTLDYDTFKKGVIGIVDIAKTAGASYGKAFEEGKRRGSKSFKASQDKKTEPAVDLLGDKKNVLDTTGGNKAPAAEPKGSPTAKATTITISIEKLVENLSINTTNVSESASKIREMVATALTDALNDSQIIAGG